MKWADRFTIGQGYDLNKSGYRTDYFIILDKLNNNIPHYDKDVGVVRFYTYEGACSYAEILFNQEQEEIEKLLLHDK